MAKLDEKSVKKEETVVPEEPKTEEIAVDEAVSVNNKKEETAVDGKEESTNQEETPSEVHEETIVKNTQDNVDLFKTFNVGDKIVVNYKIIEGDKARIQPYEGIVISKRGVGVSRTFMVRRMSVGGIGVERIFQVYSPNIDSIKVKVRGRVRRAKLYYMRDRIGKAASKVKEKKATQ